MSELKMLCCFMNLPTEEPWEASEASSVQSLRLDTYSKLTSNSICKLLLYSPITLCALNNHVTCGAVVLTGWDWA